MASLLLFPFTSPVFKKGNKITGKTESMLKFLKEFHQNKNISFALKT